MIRRVLLLVSIFLSLYIIDGMTQILDPVERIFLIVDSSILDLKSRLYEAYGCFLNPGRSVSVELGSGDVLTYWGEDLVLKAVAKKGDVVLTEDGRFIGYVDLELGDSVLVKTICSKGLRINVEVVSKDGASLEGILIGDFPPVVDVPENVDITGWSVFISRAQDMGNFLRANGKGYIGKVLGRDGKYYAVDVGDIPDRLVVLRR